ncbi:MAG: redox-sensing transcriptional repressor Rex [Planctomycetota bacterium]
MPACDPIGPAPTIRRLPRYLELLQIEQAAGRDVISTTTIAEMLSQTAIQVRKDLAITGVTGRPRVGYDIQELIAAIKGFLGWENVSDAFLVGAGHLGLALLGYEGFAEHGLQIVAAFDVDRRKIGAQHHKHGIRDLATLPALARRMHVHIAVLTVPRPVAQQTADMLVAAGIRAIWNFADPRLQVPEHVVVETVQLSASLAMLSSRLQASLNGKGLHP